ncbi:MAG: hypothetical protein C0475_06270 [Planctomyces sp.]|nr:hypothetical protein [Planctomyces sp.]MBA4040041.1 hypothetical protein [Planctomyces sp.]
MRALRSHLGRPELLSGAPDPAAEPGWAVVRVTSAAIAQPELAASAPGSAYSGVLGSHVAGVVHAVGGVVATDTPAVGRRVVINPTAPCMRCARCRSGLGAHCPERRVAGAHGLDGGLAELVRVPTPCLVPVPEGLDDATAALALTVAAAAHTAAMFRAEGKPYITVLGDGLLALTAVQVLARLNASVRLLGVRPERFTLCERWGVRHRHVDQAGRRQDQDIVVDCTGEPAGLGAALGMIRPRGRVILARGPAAVPLDGPASQGVTLAPGSAQAVALEALAANEVELVGSRDGSLREAMTLLRAGAVHVAPMITARGGMASAEQLLHEARAGAHPCAVITP